MKNKIVIISLFIFLVSLLITVNIFFQESLRSELAAQYNNQQLLIAKTVADSIHNAIDHMEDEIVALSRLLAVRGMQEQKGLDTFIKSSFEEVEINIDMSLFVLDTHGKRVISFPEGKAPSRDDMKLLENSRDLKQGEVFVTQRLKENKELKMSAPIKNDKDTIGALLLSIPIDNINEQFLSPIKSGKRGYAWMIDGSGTLLYHPTQPGMIGNNLYSADKACFKCHQSFELEKKVVEGTVDFDRYVAPSGEDKVLAFSKTKVGNTSWIVCVSSPYSEVISITSKSMKLYSGLVALIFATVFVGASVIVLINRQIVKTEIESKEALLIEKQKLDRIVSAIGSGLVLVDNQNRIQWINKTLREWAGDLEGQSDFSICSDGSSGAVSGGVTHDICKGLFGKRSRIYQVTAAPVTGTDGHKLGVLKLIQDITDIKRLEDSVLRSEKLSALGRLSAGIAHEISNPLTSISSYVQILKETVEDEFSKESLETIHHHIMRISEIVGQMSGLAKLPEMEIKRHDIHHIIETSIDIVRYDRKFNHIEIIKEYEDNLPLVYVDENYLSQVFINLMLNAADAIQEDEGFIRVNSYRQDDSVIVQFMDSGPGIDEDHQAMIFDPFFTTKEKGTGLGLSISYEILQKLGGELKYESGEERGSIFSVVLPVQGDK
jgi:C4-dicarboxylate-specific signal transduction histidine kinase